MTAKITLNRTKEEKILPNKRDWLREAHEIAGGKKEKIKLEHLQALVRINRELITRLERVQTIMKALAENDKKTRERFQIPPSSVTIPLSVGQK